MICFIPNTGFTAWQDDLEAKFDIVETFDQLQDWRGRDNLRGYDVNKEKMPVKLDGSASMWDVYDDWSNANPAADWIKNHGSGNTWNGSGKSLRMDLSQDVNAGKLGPSRFGLYFGSDTPGVANAYATSGLSNSGYNDIYYFFMVKFPSNAFPTENGDIWPNDTYKWWGYHKFTTMSTAFTDIEHINGAAGREDTGCRWEYGCGFYLMGWIPCGTRCAGVNANAITHTGLDYVADYFGAYHTQLHRDGNLKSNEAGEFFSQQESQGKWFGLEYHLTRGTPGKLDGTVEIWAYDENGNAHHIYSKDTLMFVQAGTDFSFNKFFFGGNLFYHEDIKLQNLDTTYYIDDFIIDNRRIGPTYFQLLAGHPVNENPPVIKSMKLN